MPNFENLSVLIKVTGMTIILFGIPLVSLREPFSVNEDTAYVDRRRLKRQVRKHLGVLKYHPFIGICTRAVTPTQRRGTNE